MPNIPRPVNLTGTVDGSNTVFTFTSTRTVVTVDWATYDGTLHRQADADGYTVNLVTHTVTFVYPPTVSAIQPWAQITEFIPDGMGTGTLVTSFGGEDIRITKGQDVTYPMIYTDDTGAADSLTGVLDLVVTVKRQLIDSFPIIIKKSLLTTGITITSAIDGAVNLTFVPADTVNLDEGRYMFDKWIKSSSGLFLPRGSGAFIIEGRASVLT